ncbi:MAG: molybdopterin-guanine dinucleotide biosynthesis MobB region [Deltaproteobacteria bacterium]|nr:molybdopterin-guanine dinucleotide biosynthesis MobB region [Deltaproteobacteria bacterium]
MPVVISVVGTSKAGKTTFLEKLIPELRRRRYRIGTIKHDVHDSFALDQEGKDTWRHRQAGAQTVAISSPSRIGLTKEVEEELSLDALVALYFQDEDLVFTEGYKGGNKPKIEICRKERQTQAMCSEKDGLVAVVSDFPTGGGVPCFPLEDVDRVADFIEERFLEGRSEPRLVVRLDGKKLPMKSFVKDRRKEASHEILCEGLCHGRHPGDDLHPARLR